MLQARIAAKVDRTRLRRMASVGRQTHGRLVPILVRLVGPGGSGKSTTGALLAARLIVSFVDLDRYFSERVGDISEFIEEHGYHNYARQNIENYCSLLRHENRLGVMALSSGFM